MERQVHPVPPAYNNESKILILGSFPSIKPREEKFFYANPPTSPVNSGFTADRLIKEWSVILEYLKY